MSRTASCRKALKFFHCSAPFHYPEQPVYFLLTYTQLTCRSSITQSCSSTLVLPGEAPAATNILGSLLVLWDCESFLWSNSYLFAYPAPLTTTKLRSRRMANPPYFLLMERSHLPLFCLPLPPEFYIYSGVKRLMTLPLKQFNFCFSKMLFSSVR